LSIRKILKLAKFKLTTMEKDMALIMLFKLNLALMVELLKKLELIIKNLKNNSKTIYIKISFVTST
jgi:hypothetical protein